MEDRRDHKQRLVWRSSLWEFCCGLISKAYFLLQELWRFFVFSQWLSKVWTEKIRFQSGVPWFYTILSWNYCVEIAGACTRMYLTFSKLLSHIVISKGLSARQTWQFSLSLRVAGCECSDFCSGFSPEILRFSPQIWTLYVTLWWFAEF